MWSGRFREPLNPGFDQWQRSFEFDWQLLPQEVAASQAHALALEAAGILTADERTRLADALTRIALEFSGKTAPLDPDAEDVHHFVERQLVNAVGDLGLKLHAGRSRNEQIATNLRLYTREAAVSLTHAIADWAMALIDRAQTAEDAVMPSYTHLQRAEPVLVAHWLMAYVEMLLRDAGRLRDCARRLNFCPLGSGAVAGATLSLDRSIAAQALNFSAPTANSIDATSDRDFLLEFLQVLTQLGLHMSRFAEEITLFATAEFGFIDLPEAFSTGSSAMPQKKNPDFTELVRAKVATLHGSAETVTLLLKGLPLAYNKDLQETQQPLFRACYAAHASLALAAPFTRALNFCLDRMRAAAETGFLNAMAAATYLVHKGLPFRAAHEVIGNAVRYALDKNCELENLTSDELLQFSPAFEADFHQAITIEATLNCHNVVGGTAIPRVRAALIEAEAHVRQLVPEIQAAIGESAVSVPQESSYARA